MTEIKKCPNCKPHEFQDATYGDNMRVMNSSPDKPGANQAIRWRCTACGQLKE